MNQNTEKAKNILEEKKCSLVLVDDDEIISSDEKGLSFLVNLCESGRDFQGFSASDKIVGRAAAFLFVLLEVSEVHAKVMSKLAGNILDRGEIPFYSEKIVDEIKGDDGSLDRFENAVIRSGSALVALEDIKRELKR